MSTHEAPNADDHDNLKLRVRCYKRPADISSRSCEECAVRRKRRQRAKLAIPPCCLDYMRRTGSREQCPQHQQRAAANYDHSLRLQGAQVFDQLRDSFGAGAIGSEQSWGIETVLEANPDDGSTTDAGRPSNRADAATSWLTERDNNKRSRR